MILRRISLLVNGCEEPEYIAPIAKNLTYNGSSQELLTAGSTNDGTIYYSINNSTWDVNVPSGTNAGSYTVYWKLVGDEGYCDIKSEINVTIAKADTTYTAPTAKSLTYNGSAQALLNAGAVTGGTIQYSDDNITWGTSIPTGTNANTYTSYWRIVGDGNHNDKVSASINTTIAKVTPTVVAPTAKVLTYNGSAQELVNAGSTDYGTLQYKVSSDSWSTKIPTRTRGGSYTVQYRVVGDSNVNDVAAQSVQCSINEKQVTATVTLSQTAYTYNGSACEPSVTVSDGGVVIDPSEYTVTYSNNINAGTGTVTISDNVGGDYEVIGSATFTINKVTPTVVAPTAKVLTYNGSTQELVNAGSTNYGTLKYSIDGNVYSATVPSGINATSYTVYYKVDGDGNINDIAPNTVNVTIAKADSSLSFVVTNVTVVVGGSRSNVVTVNSGDGTVTYNSNDTSVVTVDNNGSITGVSVGNTTITANISSTSNYNSASTSYTSYCVEAITAKYNVTDTSNPTIILSSTTSISDVYIDGVKQPSVTTGYTFSTTGEHTVKYKLKGTSIGNSAFTHCSGMTSIDIPDSVTSIGDDAFESCDGLTSVNIPSGVTSIGNEAFGFCDGLTSIDIPDSVTSIGNSAFTRCHRLSSCTIPSGVTSISNSVFFWCASLRSVNIPSGVTSIGASAFTECSFTSIEIPSGVTSIGDMAFFNCTSLTSVTCNATTPPIIGISSFNTYNNCPIYVPTCSLIDTYQAASVWSTYYSSRISSLDCQPIVGKINVTSTSSPTKILGQADRFISVSIDGVEQPSINTGYTFSTTGEHTVKYKIKTLSVGESAFNSCTNLTSITMPNSITSIGNYAFSTCSGLTSCTIGSGVTSIGNGAFYSAASLTSIVIPDSVISIGTSAFEYCRSLTSCTIGSGVTSIGDSAFQNCSGLTSIDIPDSVTTIGKTAFYYCSELTSWTIDSGVTSIGNGAFYSAASLTSIVIPDSVISIGTSAFDYCSGLTSCTIGSGVTSIGNSAFNECTSLSSCTIGSGVTSIGGGAFYNCSGLTSITIPDSVTSIGNYAFQYCRSLTSCTIGSGVTRISEGVFYNCSGFTSIVIPSGVTRIGNSAFENCSSLISITVEASTPPTLDGNYVFFNTNNCPIYVPCDSVDTYKAATNWSNYSSRIQAIPGSCSIVVVATFNVTDISNPTKIASGTSSFTAIEIDGVEQPSVTTGYTFSTTGTHTVKYILNGTSIGDSALNSCQSLTSIVIPDSVTSIGNSAFNSCSGLTSCTIGSGVTSIGDSVFYECTSLSSCTIGSGVTSIGSSAFTNCSGLTSIIIPSGVTSIGDYTFSNCSSLTSVSIPSGVTSIGNSAFYNCSSLTSIDIPDSVTSIGGNAFSNCSSLTSCTIGSGVTAIGSQAFYQCSGLTSIVSNAITAPTIQSNTFRNVKTGGTLIVRTGSTGYDVWMGTGNYYLGYYNWTVEIKCEESNVYELIGEPSYPSTVAASATSFNLSFDYKNTHTTITCESVVTTGSNTVSIEISENTTTSARTISGYYDFNGLNVQYTLTQEGKSEIPYAQSYAYYPFNGDIKDYSGNGRNLTIQGSTVNIESDYVQSTGGRLVSPFRMNNSISSTVSFTVFTPSNLNSDKDRYIFSAMLNANTNWINTRYCFGVPANMGNKYYFGSQAGQINNYTNGNNWDSNRAGGLNSCYNLHSINLNSKNNITIVRDVTNSKFKIYVNGTLDFEANMLDNRGGTSSSYYFTLLDEDSNRGRGYHFVDKLYNFVYWDYVLSNSEISAVANDLLNN